MKTIGVLTSGGDAPGMNAAVEQLSEKQFIMGRSLWYLWWLYRIN